MQTRNQQWAQRAYQQVNAVANVDAETRDKYSSFCKSFPALLHSSGLAQAIAYAQAKNSAYLQDLATVLNDNADTLAQSARQAAVPRYQQLSRDTLSASTWLKRYAEALLSEED